MKCPSCGNENPDKSPFCGLCQDSFVKPKLVTPELNHQPALVTAPTDQKRELNWFERHLNVTFMIPVILPFCGGIMMAVSGIKPANIESMLPAGAMTLILTILALGVWVLYEKKRSFFWLLLLFTGIGLIFFLILENHRDDPYYSRPTTPPTRAWQQTKSP